MSGHIDRSPSYGWWSYIPDGSGNPLNAAYTLGEMGPHEWIRSEVELMMTTEEAAELYYLLHVLSRHRHGLGGIYETLGRDQRVLAEIARRERAIAQSTTQPEGAP